MDRQFGNQLLRCHNDAEIGSDQGVNAGSVRIPDKCRERIRLRIARQNVRGQIDLHTLCVRRTDGVRQSLHIKVFRRRPHSVFLCSHVDRVCSEHQCGIKAFAVSGRSEQLRYHLLFLAAFWSALILARFASCSSLVTA